MAANPNNPNLPADYFLPGVQGKLYQIVAPDGRVVINFLPHHIAWGFAKELQHRVNPSTRWVFQEVPADQLGID
ncbi:hypothetical protein [Paraburkholderia tropica]|uniref:hypothetical protein n=1 Tax=Paraburkholderia tropica TaxID=92647 RepID=UPI003D2D87C9